MGLLNEQSFANGDFSKLRSSGERTVQFCKWHEMNCNELRPRAHGKPPYALTFPCKSVTLLTMGLSGYFFRKTAVSFPSWEAVSRFPDNHP
jgi:hypothetical protein